MTPTPQGVDQTPLSGPARAGMILWASVSVGFTYGYSRCCPSGSGNVPLGWVMSHVFLRHVRSPEVMSPAAAG